MNECTNECVVSADEIKRVKGLGFLQCKGTNNFNGRVITRNGKVTNEELNCIAQAAKLYGNGEITLTTRLTMEVQAIPYDNIEPFCKYLQKQNLITGGTGNKVRPVVSCKGTTCQYGLIDTFALSQKIHEEFFLGYKDITLPHKFKIAVGGCPNNCTKPNLNDIGIVGQCVPKLNKDICRGCKKCAVESFCPVNAAKIIDEKLDFTKSCINCGRCISKCPFHAVSVDTIGYKIYIGGRWGKKINHGVALNKVFISEQDVIKVIANTISIFKEQGEPGERFADTVNRIGFEKIEKQILGIEGEK